jgi:hypothetical protein
MMIEGSGPGAGSGSIPLTSGSGSGRPKKHVDPVDPDPVDPDPQHWPKLIILYARHFFLISNKRSHVNIYLNPNFPTSVTGGLQRDVVYLC